MHSLARNNHINVNIGYVPGNIGPVTIPAGITLHDIVHSGKVMPIDIGFGRKPIPAPDLSVQRICVDGQEIPTDMHRDYVIQDKASITFVPLTLA